MEIIADVVDVCVAVVDDEGKGEDVGEEEVGVPFVDSTTDRKVVIVLVTWTHDKG